MPENRSWLPPRPRPGLGRTLFRASRPGPLLQSIFGSGLCLLVAFLTGAALPLAAQETPPPPRPGDVATVDGILAAVYQAISGPQGQPRDWDRFRSLFAPGARLIPTGPASGEGRTMTVLTVEDYIQRAGPGLMARGFFEEEIGRVTEAYGSVVHLMSAYESRNAAEDPEPFARGVNSFQLFHDGERWWVVTIFWEAESPERPIPPRLLQGIR